MTRLAILLAIVPLAAVAACNVSKGVSEDNVSIKADNDGQVSFNLPFASGSLRLPQAMLENGHFDIDGVKMIPGGTIHGFNMNAGNKGAIVHLAFDAPKSPDEVRGYFLSQLKQKGDEASLSGSSVAGKTKAGDQFVIDVQPSSSGSTGTITVHSKD